MPESTAQASKPSPTMAIGTQISVVRRVDGAAATIPSVVVVAPHFAQNRESGGNAEPHFAQKADIARTKGRKRALTRACLRPLAGEGGPKGRMRAAVRTLTRRFATPSPASGRGNCGVRATLRVP